MSFPKGSNMSVGVARQCRGALGKPVDCQVAVSVHVSRRGLVSEARTPISYRVIRLTA
jgi:SRSO17 transposase